MNFHALHILNKNFCTSYLLCVGNKTDFLTNTEFERKNKVNNVIIHAFELLKDRIFNWFVKLHNLFV
jgi:hypothetical protein